MTYTAAVRVAEVLAREFTAGADLTTPLVREDMRRVVSDLIGEQTGAFRAAVDAFETIWTTAGGTLVWAH